jgi:hypothetical protein
MAQTQLGHRASPERRSPEGDIMPRQIRHFLVAAAVLAASVGLIGQDDRTIYGAGTNTCAQWTQARDAGENWFTAGQWILGFVSAANQYAKVPPARSDARWMARWVDDYCREHADHDVADAAHELVEALLELR